jgi:hypothetical protein
VLKGTVAGLALALLLDARLRRRRQLSRSPAAPPGDRDLSDEELVARVLAMVDVPSTVEVTAVEGAVVLFGRVPRFVLPKLRSRVADVPGVVDVEDRLTPVDDLGAGERR